MRANKGKKYSCAAMVVYIARDFTMITKGRTMIEIAIKQ